MTIEKSATNFLVSASTVCKKANTAGADENLFRLVPVPGHGARVQPLELVRKFVLGHQQKAMFRLMPVPGRQSERGLNRGPGRELTA